MLSSCYAASLSTIQGLRCLSMKGAEDIALANGRQIYTAGVEDIALANGGRFYTGGNEASEEFTDEDAVDDSSVHQPEKKRRLTFEQVKFLETNFELENKLEPDRKVQLAKDLNLQPRQVAVWFQNRRARWKTKQLEKDYDALKLNYNSMKADHESLLLENEQLQEEISSLTTKLLERPVNNDDWLESDCTARRQNLNGRKDGRESYTVPAQHCIEKKHGNDEKREASESSGSDQSGVCESDSPVPTDSGLSKGDGKKSDSKNPLVSTVEARADVSTCFEDVLSTNSFPHQFVKTEIEEDDQSHSYVFILEDQGAIPWGSFTWP